MNKGHVSLFLKAIQLFHWRQQTIGSSLSCARGDLWLVYDIKNKKIKNCGLPLVENLHLRMSEEERTKMARAIIVGGSIAGVSCAHALMLAGWDVVVLEKTGAPPTGSPTGAGLGLDPLAQKLIESCLADSDSLRNVTLPLTIDQVHSVTLSLHFPFSGTFSFHETKHLIFMNDFPIRTK